MTQWTRDVWTALSVVSFSIWVYLLFFRGGFWRARIRDDVDLKGNPVGHKALSAASHTKAQSIIEHWPSLAVVIPARNEADVIRECLGSLLREDYPQPFNIILVDDLSDDGTAVVAKTVAERANAAERVHIIRGLPLPSGWTGKLWAMKQGIDWATRSTQNVPGSSIHAASEQKSDQRLMPKYLLLTDADIAYDQGMIKRLVARAEAENNVLTSVMVKLRCESLIEKLLIPAFVFFFQMLYPFSWVGRRDHKLAAAAGGCMLVRTEAFLAAGGVGAIRGSLIDDCALGRVMKRQGKIWLGLSQNAHSLRPYGGFNDVRRMVARSAYDQLNYSLLLLIGTLVGMMMTYVVPPALALFGQGSAQILGGVTWVMMCVMFIPILRFYRLSPVWALFLPLIAACYMFFTLDSAYQHWRGQGGLWKGRAQARQAEAQ